MASPAAVLNVLVTANTKAASAQLYKVQGQMEATEKRSHALGKAAGLAGLALGGALAVGAKAGFDELKQSQKVAAQTNAVLKSTGSVAHVTARHVDELAQSLLKKSGIDDEAAKSGENMLLTFRGVRNEAGKGNKIFDQATKAITDMAFAMGHGVVPSGEQMSRTAIQVGKALQDPVKGATALRRVGVSLTEEQQTQIKTLVGMGNAVDNLKLAGVDLTAKQKQQINVLGDLANPLKAAKDLNLKLTDAQRQQLRAMEDGTGKIRAQKMILAELNKEFGGSAQAAGKTLPGQLNILKETLKNLAASIVSALVPALQAMVGPLQAVANYFSQHQKLAKILVGALAGLAAVLMTVSIAEKVYVAATKIATATQWLFNAALAANPITLVIAALAALGVAVVLAYKKFKPFRDAVNNVWGALKDTFSWAKEHWPLLASILGGPFVAAGIQIAKHFGSIKSTVVGFINDIITIINKLPFVNIPHIGGASKTVGNPHIPAQKLAEGGKVTMPVAIMGEEAPRHPEWVIPTNPAYRQRAIGLWMSAAHDIGVPGFALGGVIDKAGSIARSVTGLNLPSNPLKGTFLAKMGSWLLEKAAHFITSKASSGFGAVKGLFTGSASVHGLLPRVLRAVAWARSHGWQGTVTSGYRSHAQQQYLWDHAAQLGLVRGVSVAKPGTSSHEMGAAVDVTDIPGFRKAMASAPPDSRLLWRGLSDPVHFSITGHRKGGLLKFAKGGVLSAAALGSLASQAGFSKGAIPLAVAIALAESGGRKNAMNRNSDGSIDRGLWQINSTHGHLSTFNPLANARAAYAISHGGHDWKPWTTFRTGAYKKFLTRGYSVVGKIKSSRPFHLVASKGGTTGGLPGVGGFGGGTFQNGSFTPGPSLPTYTGGTGDAGTSGTDTSAQDLLDAIKELKASIDAQTNFANSVAGITSFQAVKAMADVISGQIMGRGYAPRATTASSGQTVTF